MEWPDVVGTCGVIILLSAYFLLQRGTVGGHSLGYLLMNITASVCILVSLAATPNVPSILIQVCWILISLYGLRKWWHLRRVPEEGDDSIA